jgi:DNA-binding CsgD family transcriptional regulator
MLAGAALPGGSRDEVRREALEGLVRSLGLDAVIIWCSPKDFEDAGAWGLLREIGLRYFAGRGQHAADPALQTVAARGLSPREREVVSYVSLGYTNREIGLACGTSAHTVHNQLRSVFRKLDVCTRAELVRVVMSNGDE